MFFRFTASIALTTSLLMPAQIAQAVDTASGANTSTTGSTSTSVRYATPSKVKVKEGTAIATITAPRLGASWKKTIYEGTSVPRVLTPLGPGHYSMTQMPGEVGNFAVAGHRFGSGGPFLHIDWFRKGDLVTVKNKAGTFTYRYLQTKIVMPSAVGVVYPVPVGLTVPHTTDSFLTLQTCTPVHINTKRLIVWFELIKSDFK